jgi:hypothetical protein
VSVLAPVDAPAPGPADTAARRRATDWLRRPVVMCVLLLLVYGVVALAKDPRASLVSDSGGKLATLRVMEQRGDLDPDLGYWAERFDPDGLAHPMPLTMHIGDKWVNVTTLPMIYAAEPLYELGGFRMILLIPMLAGVATALGARALARRLGDDGTRAFWLVGLATPVAVYALDFWEHAPGLACMVWGVVLLFDVAEGRRAVGAALAGGALFGAAATMRTEALVYAAAAFAVLGIAAWRRRGRPPVAVGAAAVAGLLGLAALNQVLERLVLGSGLRAGRTSGAASRAGGELATRARDALVTSVGLNRFPEATDWAFGTLMVVGLAAGVALLLWGGPARRRLAFVALGGATYGYLVWFSKGLGFLPGALTASPLAAAGLAAMWWRPRLRVVGAVALVAVPVVWAFQYSNGTTAIWGGRYLLCTSTVLAVLATVVMPTLPRGAARWVTVLAVAVTASGLLWTVDRTHTVADAWADLDGIRGPVVMVQEVQLMREGGAFYDSGQQWLAARDDPALRAAVSVADRIGADRVTFLTVDDTTLGRTVGPYRRAGGRSVEIVPGVDLRVRRYVR